MAAKVFCAAATLFLYVVDNVLLGFFMAAHLSPEEFRNRFEYVGTY